MYTYRILHNVMLNVEAIMLEGKDINLFTMHSNTNICSPQLGRNGSGSGGAGRHVHASKAACFWHFTLEVSATVSSSKNPSVWLQF